MDIQHIKSFLFVAKTGSFTRTAEQLGYVQSSVSAHVSTLEKELGVKLFYRDAGKRVVLTPEGKQLLPMAEELLAISNKIVTSLIPRQETLTIATIESLSNSRLKMLFQTYHAMYPQVNLTLQYGNCSENLIALRDGRVDLAVLLDKNMIDSDIEVQFSCLEPICFFSALSHFLASQDRVDAGDLEGAEMILTEKGCSYHDALIDFTRANNITPKRIVEVNSIAAIVEFVRAGQGITLLPEIAVLEEVNCGKLIPLKWAGTRFDTITQMVVRRGKEVKSSTKLFLEMARFQRDGVINNNFTPK